MREEIIKMARSAGFKHSQITIYNCERLERFFHMAQAAMVEQGWRKCAEGQRTTQFCGMAEKAVLAEREACAKLCEAQYIADGSPEDVASTQCAAAIRARGQA